MKVTFSTAAPLLLMGFGSVHLAAIAPSVTAQVQVENSREPAVPTGGLFAATDNGEQQVFPLQHTEVKAKVSGNVSRVEVTQTFENPFDNPLEAVYVFPLPDEAAVDDMEIRIGDRIIKGDIKKREEARAIYDQARAAGQTAGLLEQERANIFTQSLANIKPGEQIDVTIRYTDSLKFEGGDYEFVFPMVVGPRFIPGTPVNPPDTPTDPTRPNGGLDSNRVPDASRITPPVLRPGTRSGHDIQVMVEIEAGGLVQEVRSPSHAILTEQQDETVVVTLNPEDTIPNKDLILRYQVSGANTQATVLTQTGDQGGHFALYLIPAVDYRPNEIVPKDVVFLIDTSGSQRGEPIAQSKRLMERFITGLNPDDTFTIIDFANAAQSLSPEPLANTQENRDRALEYVAGLSGNGGTQLLNGIDTVLNFPPATGGRLRSVVLLTDGLIGNDNEAIARIQSGLPYGNRLYSFGVGSSVNRFLLDRLAEVGRGTLHVVRHDEPIDQTVETFFQQINNPVLTNIRVFWEGEGYPELYPSYIPDLFANQPLVVFGRHRGATPGRLRISGVTARGRRYTETVEVDFEQGGNLGIAQLWGRARIKDLMTRMVDGETRSGIEAVTNTALDYRLLSQYTAFVAVSEEVRVDPDGTRHTVAVPVELPDGTRYDGFFGDQDEDDGTLNFLGAAPTSTTRGATRGGIMSAPARPAPAPAPAPALPPSVAPPPVGDIAPAPAPAPALPPSVAPPPVGDIAPAPEPEEAESPIVLAVVEADGLDQAAIDALNQHLSTLTIAERGIDELSVELELKDGKVEKVTFEDAIAFNPDLLEQLRQHLEAWQHSQEVTGTYTVKLQKSSS